MVEESSREDLRHLPGIFGYSNTRTVLSSLPTSPFYLFPYYSLVPVVEWSGILLFRIRSQRANICSYFCTDYRILKSKIPLEIFRIISLPRWFSYPLIFIFFEALHDQRSLFEHPIMWMGGYMLIVAYGAGRTRSLLHAILFCILVHEAYNLSCYLLHPALYPNPF